MCDQCTELKRNPVPQRSRRTHAPCAPHACAVCARHDIQNRTRDTSSTFCSLDLYTYMYIVVVVLTLTHNTMQSVAAGQAPNTLEWKKYLGSKKEAKIKNNHTHSTTADTREAKRGLLIADKNLKKKMKRTHAWLSVAPSVSRAPHFPSAMTLFFTMVRLVSTRAIPASALPCTMLPSLGETRTGKRERVVAHRRAD